MEKNDSFLTFFTQFCFPLVQSRFPTVCYLQVMTFMCWLWYSYQWYFLLTYAVFTNTQWLRCPKHKTVMFLGDKHQTQRRRLQLWFLYTGEISV